MFVFLTSLHCRRIRCSIVKLQVKHANENQLYKKKITRTQTHTYARIFTKHARNEVTYNKNTCLIHSLEYNVLCTKFADNSAFAKLQFTLYRCTLFIVVISSRHFSC